MHSLVNLYFLIELWGPNARKCNFKATTAIIKQKKFFIYLTDSDKFMPAQSTLLGAALRLQRESKNLFLWEQEPAIEIETPYISKVERSEKGTRHNQNIKLAGFFDVNKNYIIPLWLCDHVLHAVDKYPLTEQV
jgi:hypothetical protein